MFQSYPKRTIFIVDEEGYSFSLVEVKEAEGLKIKTFWTIILIPLLISTLILASPIHFVKAEAQTIYVDDDNISGPWDGSLVNPYQNITSGLENALAGDTVFVYDGVYPEHINVTKSVSLIGLNPATTVIDGSGERYLPIININASNVLLENFTVQNTSTAWMMGYGILVWQTTNVTLQNILVTNCNYGVVIGNSSNCKLLASTLGDNFDTAIVLRSGSSYNHIIGNDISGNLVGLYIADSSSKYNVFYRNNMISNTNHYSIFGTYTIWDNGVEGNYWDDYFGADLDGDGIGNVPHLGVDYHPLVEPWSTTRVYLVNLHKVTVVCNYTVASFRYNQSLKQISFQITGPSEGEGYCNITIPEEVLSPQGGSQRWIAMFDSNPLNFESTTIGNLTLISFKYTLQSSATTSQVRLQVGTLYPPTANFMFSPYPASIIEPVNFTDTSTDSLNGSIISRQWNFGDGSPIIESNETFLTHLFDRKMFYNVTLTVRDINNLTHSVTRVILVQNLRPSANFTFQPTSLLAGWEIQFNASKSHDVDGAIEKYSWNFGDGANITFVETTPLTTHIFEHTGIYNTTLTVHDDDGAKNSVRHLMTVEKGPSILMIEFPPTVQLEETFLINLTLTNKAGQPLSNSKVSLYVHGDSAVQSKNSTTDINGLAEVTFSLNTLGNYQIEGEFLGDSDYFGNNASAALLVNPLDTHISIQLPQNSTQNQLLVIAVTLEDGKGTPLQNRELDFYIKEGDTWTILGSSSTDQDGDSSLDYIPQSVGVITFKVVFERTEIYMGATSEGSLEVLPTGIDYLIVVLLAVVAGGVILLIYLILRRKSSLSVSPPS